jgi:hypothetical protein
MRVGQERRVGVAGQAHALAVAPRARSEAYTLLSSVVRRRCSEARGRRHPDARGVRVSRGGRGRVQEVVTGTGEASHDMACGR